MEKSIELYYQQIASLIIDMLPEEWTEVKFYTEVDDEEGSQEDFFFYQSAKSGEWIYYTTIPEKFKVSKEKFDELGHELCFCILDFKEAYQEEFGETWTSFQMVLYSNGKFNIHFNYKKNPLGPIKTHVIWEYEQLGIEQKDGLHKDLLEEYLEEKAKGKRYPFLEPMKEE